MLNELIGKLNNYSEYLKKYAYGEKQIKDKKLHRIRQAYGRLYIEAIKTSALLWEKKEIQELSERLDELEAEQK